MLCLLHPDLFQGQRVEPAGVVGSEVEERTGLQRSLVHYCRGATVRSGHEGAQGRQLEESVEQGNGLRSDAVWRDSAGGGG